MLLMCFNCWRWQYDCSIRDTAAMQWPWHHISSSGSRSTWSQVSTSIEQKTTETKVEDRMNDTGISSRLTQHISYFIFISWYKILEMLTEFLHLKQISKKYWHFVTHIQPFPVSNSFSIYPFTIHTVSEKKKHHCCLSTDS